MARVAGSNQCQLSPRPHGHKHRRLLPPLVDDKSCLAVVLFRCLLLVLCCPDTPMVERFASRWPEWQAATTSISHVHRMQPPHSQMQPPHPIAYGPYCHITRGCHLPWISNADLPLCCFSAWAVLPSRHSYGRSLCFQMARVAGSHQCWLPPWPYSHSTGSCRGCCVDVHQGYIHDWADISAGWRSKL